MECSPLPIANTEYATRESLCDLVSVLMTTARQRRLGVVHVNTIKQWRKLALDQAQVKMTQNIHLLPCTSTRRQQTIAGARQTHKGTRLLCQITDNIGMAIIGGSNNVVGGEKTFTWGHFKEFLSEIATVSRFGGGRSPTRKMCAPRLCQFCH